MATLQGANPKFAQAIEGLIAASGGKVSLSSGFRSKDQQQALYNAAEVAHPGEAGKWAAPPGHSNHERGTAADLGGGPGALALAHQLAAQFGLYNPMPWEPWHFELIGGAKGSPQAYTTDPNAPDNSDIGTHLQAFQDLLDRPDDASLPAGENVVGASGQVVQ